MLRREIKGNAISTTLYGQLNAGDGSIVVSDGSSFPVGSVSIPFVITVDRGTSSEEKILISDRSVNTLTVLSRGYDGTTDVVHLSGSTVDHVLDATSLQDMNTTVYDTKILTWMGL
jgi:hypothetical protein